jgi:predicted patatin/cPLA2 family phospholipase
MTLSKEQHMDRTITPKRILALDGGGIRGILTLEYLEGIETLLRQRSGNQKLLLSDYFDLIGGTSTGSIIAAALACGMSVAELKTVYAELGAKVFEQKFYRRGLLVPKFPAGPLHEALETHLGADTTLDGARLRTGVMIMTKRLDTGSPWPLHNHPDAAYAAQDGRLLLTQVVRASTAAPTYFEPEQIEISSRDGSSVLGAFVDGGVSPYNDPALQMLQLAALQGHGLKWQTGSDKLLLVSIGTGTYKQTYTTQELKKMMPAEQGLRALQSLMDDCSRSNHGMLQWLTKCLTPWRIDRAVGDMVQDSQLGPQLATYVRYNVLLEAAWLKRELAIERSPESVAKIAEMDNPGNMVELAEIGKIAAAKQVAADHFPQGFDI